MAYTNTAPIAIPPQAYAHVATGILTLTANPSDGETLTIGGKAYQFQTSLTNSDGNVKIGANAAASIANLVAAINLAAGAGTTYAASMTLHATATASVNAASTSAMDVKAKQGGTAGLLATTETLANGVFGAATLTFPAPVAISLASQAFTNTAPNEKSQSYTYGNTAPVEKSQASFAYGNTAPIAKTTPGLPTAITARLASTGNVDTSSFAGSIDGVALVSGDIVLLKDQTNAFQNGVYTVSITDGIGTWTLHTSADSLAEYLLGLLITVSLGTVNTHKRFFLTNARFITDNSLTLLGDYPPNFAEFVPIAIPN